MNDIVAYEHAALGKQTEITYGEAAELTRELLDEIYQPFKLGDLSYPASVVLEAVDPVAFRAVVLEEIDYRISEGLWTEDPPE